MQLTMRLRRPGIILLHGEKAACAATRTALEALGPGFRCEVWYVPEASTALQVAVQQHDGEVWRCRVSALRKPAQIVGPHGSVQCADFPAAVWEMLS